MACVLGIVGDGFGLFGLETVDCEALTGCLGGAHSAVVHIFVFDVYEIFCFFMGMVFVGAELFCRSIGIL